MKYAFAQLAFGLGANALVARESPQCVQLKASGGASGVLGQLSDGQNRVGGGHPTGCYCLSNGGFTDTNGSGCILTPPTKQFQCDAGASPTSGFTIGSGGEVAYNGNGKFYACPVNDNGEYNVYTQPVSGQAKCVEISLSSTGSCGSGSTSSKSSSAAQPSQSAQSQTAQASEGYPTQPAQSSQPASSTLSSQAAPQSSKPTSQTSQSAQPSTFTASQSAPQPSASASGCPTDLNGNYQYPHLIIPVNSQQPSKSYGTSYFGAVNSTTCSIFNFDIPASYSGKTCTVLFLFPEQKDLETSSYTVSGNGTVDFSKLKGPASQQTTYANQPGKESELQSLSVAPGNSYTIASGSCAAGQTVTYELCSQGDFSLNYFQDYNPSPIGLYVRSC